METNSPLSLKEINSGQKNTIQEGGFLHTPHQELLPRRNFVQSNCTIYFLMNIGQPLLFMEDYIF